jgi:F-type H+-transporting ATPase subunit alpha
MIQQFDDLLSKSGEVGQVVKMNYPIVVADGLPGAGLHELVLFENGEMGEIIELNRNYVQIALFSRSPVGLSSRIVRTGSTLQVPVGEQLLGLLIDPLGTVIYGDPAKLANTDRRSIYSPIPPIKNRRRVSKQFFTGVTSIDLLVPIGKGQKEILVGDRRVGKRSLALRAALTAARRGEIVVFCSIGQTLAELRAAYEFFVQYTVLDNVIHIATSAHDSPYMIFRAPHAAMVHAEYFRDLGRDVLIIFDDLSTHAQFYREVSLLAERFPGRESYPGDIFYIHSNLLEHAGNFAHSSGREVSITCLPLVHVHESDLTSYIATNAIGISDGHLLLDRELLLRGVRPPLHLGLSVTRAGRQTQTPFLRDMNHIVTTSFAEYDKIRNYSQFGAELNPKIKEVLNKGSLLHLYFEQMSMADTFLLLDVFILGLILVNSITEMDVDGLQSLYSRVYSSYQSNEYRAFFEQIASLNGYAEFKEYIANNAELVRTLCES